jgi:hypothetical protein
MKILRFDPFGEPLCDECQAHMSEEHDRLYDSFRAVILSDPDLPFGPVRRSYFRAFHYGGHVKNADWDAVDAAEDRPRNSFQRFLDERRREREEGNEPTE